MNQPLNSPAAAAETTAGFVTRVRGSVVDVEFPAGALPAINDAITIALEGAVLIIEVQEHLDPHTVRGVAMQNPSGLQRGAAVSQTGSPIRVPVGEKVLGRLINVIGDPIDRLAPFGPELRLAGRFIAARRPSIIRITSARSSAPASRSPIFSRRSRAAVKPGCSAAPASARPC